MAEGAAAVKTATGTGAAPPAQSSAGITRIAAAHAGEQGAEWGQVLGLRCDLAVEVPLPGFKVSDLARLAPQIVVPSQWRVGEDVPLRINGQLIAWSEFEVVRGQLAVRITELR